MSRDEIILGGAVGFVADTILEGIHATFPQAREWFPYNIQPFPLPNGDDLIQALIPIGFALAKKPDLAVGSAIYVGFNLLRYTLINLIYMGKAPALQRQRV